MDNTQYLKLALTLAASRRGFCAPNPCVGAVLVKKSRIIATGYHLENGAPHAEAEALNKVDPKLAEQATLYVTLQPCNHNTKNKKTPPCTKLIIERKISKVIYGFQDPNPAVEKTDYLLRQAGIECLHYPLPAITHFYRSYQFWRRTKRPFTTAKLAISLDGKSAGKEGQRIQLTGDVAQHFTHQQRKQTDAILTTAKTICSDDPLLNCRINNKSYKKPIYIIDSTLSVPNDAKIFFSAKNVTIFHDAHLSSKFYQKFTRRNLRFIPIKKYQSGLSLTSVLSHIGHDGCHDLWIETGGQCFQSFAKKRLLQRAFIFVAPQWLGDQKQTAFSLLNPLSSLSLTQTFALGDDACFDFSLIGLQSSLSEN